MQLEPVKLLVTDQTPIFGASKLELLFSPLLQEVHILILNSKSILLRQSQDNGARGQSLSFNYYLFFPPVCQTIDILLILLISFFYRFILVPFVNQATMICIDNSEWMRNGDYSPTRFQAQTDAVNLICGAKTQVTNHVPHYLWVFGIY